MFGSKTHVLVGLTLSMFMLEEGRWLNERMVHKVPEWAASGAGKSLWSDTIGIAGRTDISTSNENGS